MQIQFCSLDDQRERVRRISGPLPMKGFNYGGGKKLDSVRCGLFRGSKYDVFKWPDVVIPKLTWNGAIPEFSIKLIHAEELEYLDSPFFFDSWSSNSEDWRAGVLARIRIVRFPKCRFGDGAGETSCRPEREKQNFGDR